MSLFIRYETRLIIGADPIVKAVPGTCLKSPAGPSSAGSILLQKGQDMTDNSRAVITRKMGQRLRIARTLKGLAVDRLAMQASLTRTKLQRFESGTGQMTADELVQVASILELPLWFFFEVSVSKESPACPLCGSSTKSPPALDALP